MEFLNTENNLWYYWKNYTPDSYKNANQEVKRLMQKMDNFDKHNLNKVGNRLEQIIFNCRKFTSTVASKPYLRCRAAASYQEVHGVTEGARTDQHHVR